MGGHIALRFLHDHPTAVSRAVLTAPLIDIIPSPYPRWIAIILTRLAVNTGFTHAYVLGAKYRNPFDQAFQGNPLTSDPCRFGFDKQAITDNPDLALGEPTFGWVAATLDSIAMLKQAGYAEGIETPVMMISAGKDRIVCCEAQKRICLRMPDCRLKVLDESLHEILMEADPIRERFWRAFDRFVD
jgi:lysophospholipase